MVAALRRVMVSGWEKRGAQAWLLWPVSLLYGMLSALRRRLYGAGVFRVRRAAVPVVVVGNVVAGGAGKTPVLMALVRHLGRNGIAVGVVSRGYGRHGKDCREVFADSLAVDVGDEPLMIRQLTGVPVFVAARRIDAANALLAAYPHVRLLVCDDGLQHYGLHRDIELCVFDERGIGNALLLPAGPLREPWPRHCDLVLYTGVRPAPEGYRLTRTLHSHGRRADGSQLALSELQDTGIEPRLAPCAVAGIARPEVFFDMLRERGLVLARTEALDDHAEFDPSRWPATGSGLLLCTEKDATKLWRYRPDALAVPLVLEIEPAFWHAFDRLVTASLAAKL